MLLNFYNYLTPLYLIYSFLMQKPKLNRFAKLLLLVSIFTISQFSLIYRDTLLPLFYFIIFFVILYWNSKDVSKSIIYTIFPLIIYFVGPSVNNWFSYPNIAISIMVNLGWISLFTFLFNQAVEYMMNRWEFSQSIVYNLLLICFFLLYYRQINQLFIYFGFNYDSWIFLFTLVFALIVFLLMMILTIFDSSNRQIQMIEQEKAKIELNNQFSQLISQQYDEVRAFRHDYHNLLLALNGYIQDEKWEQLHIFFNKELHKYNNIEQTSNQQLEKLVYIHHSGIRHLLYAKLIYAQSLGITIHLELQQVFQLEHAEINSLPRILGIILDNAIEEARLINKGELAVAFIENEDSQTIIVSNSMRHESMDIHTIKTKGYTSKESNSGLGLYNLDQLILPSNLLLNTQAINYVFTQEIVIPKEVG
ncbi:GHKL domain-containing protein [Fundicoccus sp. Sow4_H7]|uniref:GHKL domain-containing protein n=1 Tax=Fundicoccus sp. Sow4_H7 TaxID=3438784 RepID=UPI003F9004BA